jgi:hypothetical protein
MVSHRRQSQFVQTADLAVQADLLGTNGLAIGAIRPERVAHGSKVPDDRLAFVATMILGFGSHVPGEPPLRPTYRM